MMRSSALVADNTLLPPTFDIQIAGRAPAVTLRWTLYGVHGGAYVYVRIVRD